MEDGDEPRQRLDVLLEDHVGQRQRPLRARSQSLRPGKAPVAAVESEFKAFGGNYFFHNEIAAPFKDAGLFEWFVEEGEATK